MDEVKKGALGAIGTIMAAVVLAFIFLCFFAYAWPLFQGDWKELPGLLQIPFSILFDIFSPKEAMATTASGQEVNTLAFGALAVLALLIILFGARTLIRSKVPKKEKPKEEE